MCSSVATRDLDQNVLLQSAPRAVTAFWSPFDSLTELLEFSVAPYRRRGATSAAACALQCEFKLAAAVLCEFVLVLASCNPQLKPP